MNCLLCQKKIKDGLVCNRRCQQEWEYERNKLSRIVQGIAFSNRLAINSVETATGFPDWKVLYGIAGGFRLTDKKREIVQLYREMKK